MKIYAITGGIGSGKSTVAKFLDKKGFPVISADSLNLEVSQLPEVQKQILDRFGTLDRMELRKLIFGNEPNRKDIEAIMHPRVQALFFQKFNDLADKDFAIVFYESALVFELKQEASFEGVIVVDCSEKVRLDRILQRDNMTEEVARNIMACQVSDKYRREHADFVVHNEAGVEYLEERVDRLLRAILQTPDSPSTKSWHRPV